MYVRIISIECSCPRKWKVVINSWTSNFKLNILLFPSLFYGSWANSELVASVNITTKFYLDHQVNHSSWLTFLTLQSCWELYFKCCLGRSVSLGYFEKKIHKDTISFLHARLSAWNKSVTTGPIFVKSYVWGLIQKYIEKLQFSLKSGKNNGCFTWRPV